MRACLYGLRREMKMPKAAERAAGTALAKATDQVNAALDMAYRAGLHVHVVERRTLGEGEKVAKLTVTFQPTHEAVVER